MTKIFNKFTVGFISLIICLLVCFGMFNVKTPVCAAEDIPDINDYVEGTLEPGINIENTFLFIPLEGSSYFETLVFSGVSLEMSDATNGIETKDFFLSHADICDIEDVDGFWFYITLDEINASFQDGTVLSDLVVEDGTSITKYKYYDTSVNDLDKEIENSFELKDVFTIILSSTLFISLVCVVVVIFSKQKNRKRRR